MAHQINTASFRRAARDIIMDTDNQETCANCGKGEEESDSLKLCTACKMVKYCSRDCQKAHHQHKKECRKRAAELHDEALFKQPPQAEDCPICFMRMPSISTGWRYNACCGKIVCSGCDYEGVKMDGNADQLCPFCRAPAPFSDEEIIKLVMKRVDMGDAQGIYSLGFYYSGGMYGMPQDRNKALELWHRAGELGHAAAYHNIGIAYDTMQWDEKMATHYYELAAMGGDQHARNYLGTADARAANIDRALKHYMIAVEGGDHESVKMIQQMCKDGHATKDDYAKALQAYQAYLEEIKSDDRDKAAEYDEMYKYYE